MARFDDLPPELRAAIWEYTLPEDENAIYIFNPEWANEFFPSRPQGPNSDDDFNPCLPARIQVPIPGVYNVSRDARPVVHRWMAKNNLQWYDRQETDERIIVRSFDVQRDILYVPQDEWDMFEGFVNSDELDLEEHQNLRNNIINLAVSADSMSSFGNAEDIARLMLRALNLKKIYVIFNDLPRVEKITTSLPNGRGWWSDIPVQQRCEIASQPKPHERVHIHRLDRHNQLRQFEKVYLRDPQKMIDSIWRILVEGFPDIAHSVTKELKMPRVDVTVMQVPTWDIVG
ncbi:hypothetical protein FDENT_3359 [Fusarium denticulatum]|uniref:2EXR domain-containing protein n=1 Tax=Fusarium denticulatum TaxID=48507 RepID=A0A8H5XD93_9HYPO|nr:hypothetical protein FDENT_14247 [Fusarium denticulatum]KAF5691538.1 hypothetical protein FDENT_3359 [Fusarium denticulatum]